MTSRGAGLGLEMEKISLEQLRALKEQAGLEFNLFQDSLNNIRTATARIEIASTVLHDLSLRPPREENVGTFDGVADSLYVPGSLDDADKVLVDVGTGYFIEKTMVEGNEYSE